MDGPIDVTTFFDRRPISGRQWLLVAICFLVMMADGMDVTVMGFVTPSILREWHVSRAAFGLVISAAPLGLVPGALAAGPLSDRYGRKGVLVVAVALFGLFMLAAARAGTPLELAVLRGLAGSGIGAAMPNTSPLVAEYAPLRRRSLIVTLMFIGFNVGAAAIGFAASFMIPRFGWRSVLELGGVFPVLLVPLIVLLVPESARLMAVRGATAARIARVLRWVSGEPFTGAERFVALEQVPAVRWPVGVLFSSRFARVTGSLWTTYFMGLLVIALLSSWLATMMRDAGLSIGWSTFVTALFQTGGVLGSIVVGWMMDWRRPASVLACAYAAGAVMVLGVAWAGVLSPAFAVLALMVGMCVSGAQTGLNALAPACYPTVARATGVSWMLGIGRFGSITGSAAGGALLSLHWSAGSILGLLAIPATCAALAARGAEAVPSP